MVYPAGGAWTEYIRVGAVSAAGYAGCIYFTSARDFLLFPSALRDLVARHSSLLLLAAAAGCWLFVDSL